MAMHCIRVTGQAVPRPHLLIYLTALVLISLPSAWSAAMDSDAAKTGTDRLSVPDEIDQRRPRRLVREIFAPEYAQTDRESMRELGEELLQLGVTDDDSAAVRFVLLMEAINLAIDAGDVSLTLSAIDHLSRLFEVNRSEEKLKAFRRLRATAGEELVRNSGAVLQAAIDEAIGGAEYRIASQIARVFLRVVSENNDQTLEQLARHLSRETLWIARQSAKAIDATAILRTNPDDSQAHRVLGLFLCIASESWEPGLAHLAASDDPELRDLALLELNLPAETTAHLDLADKWWAYAESRPEYQRSRFRTRAVHWYERARPTVSGLAKVRVERRLAEAGEILTQTIAAKDSGPIPPDLDKAGAAPPQVTSRDITLGGSGQTIRIEQTMFVRRDDTLTILPGTKLLFAPDAGLDVDGSLMAEGTESDPIVFGPIELARGWLGIHAKMKSRKGRMTWCVVTRARRGIQVVSRTEIENCAFVRNEYGFHNVISSSSVVNTVIIDSLKDGVRAGHDLINYRNVSIIGSGGIGYVGTHKGWGKLDRCVITQNRGGGLRCKVGGGTYRGRPTVANSNIHENAAFDIWCDQKESYEFKNVFVGFAASRQLALDPYNTTVPNIRDRRTMNAPNRGIVIIDPVPLAPISDAGAPEAVMNLADKYR